MINEMFDLLSDKICAIHVKDFVIEEGKMKKALPGEGLLNFELIMKRVRECGIDVPFVSEEINEELAKKAFSEIIK